METNQASNNKSTYSFSLEKTLDSLFSGMVATSASGLSYLLWQSSVTASQFCQEINTTGFNALQNYLPLNTTVLIDGCTQVLNVNTRLAKACNYLNNPYTMYLASPEIKDTVNHTCSQLIHFNTTTNNVCDKIKSSGLEVFEHIGSLDTKQLVLDKCTSLDSQRVFILCPLVITSSFAAYYAIRFFSSLIPQKNKL